MKIYIDRYGNAWGTEAEKDEYRSLPGYPSGIRERVIEFPAEELGLDPKDTEIVFDGLLKLVTELDMILCGCEEKQAIEILIQMLKALRI
jgi:hypothetical protein